MKKLECSNTECESHESNALFNISVTVGEDRDISENLNKVEPEYFSCAHCGSEATEGTNG